MIKQEINNDEENRLNMVKDLEKDALRFLESGDMQKAESLYKKMQKIALDEEWKKFEKKYEDKRVSSEREREEQKVKEKQKKEEKIKSIEKLVESALNTYNFQEAGEFMKELELLGVRDLTSFHKQLDIKKKELENIKEEEARRRKVEEDEIIRKKEEELRVKKEEEIRRKAEEERFIKEKEEKQNQIDKEKKKQEDMQREVQDLISRGKFKEAEDLIENL